MKEYDFITITENIELEFKPTRLYIKELHELKYFGKSILSDIEKYTGSGKHWLNHISKYGKENIKTTWVSDWFTCPHKIQEYAIKFSKEHDIINSTEWANICSENGIYGGIRINNHFVEWSKLPKSKDIRDNISKSAKGNNRGSIPVTIDNVQYLSIISMAKAYNISESTARKWVKSGKAIALKQQKSNNYNSSKSIKVNINGINFPSILQAMKHFHISYNEAIHLARL